MEDVDLLVPRDDHQRALAALGAAGWRVVRPGGPDRYDTVLAHDEVPSLLLELHFGLEGSSHRVTALDPGTLWAHRRPLEVAGSAAFGLRPDDELVVLASHAGKPHHGFVRLMWIADLAMIVDEAAARGAPVDWDRVRAVAGEARCVTVVAAALALARHAGVEAPSELFPLPARGSARPPHDAVDLGPLAAHPPRAAGVRAELRVDRRTDATAQDPARAPRLGAPHRDAGPRRGRVATACGGPRRTRVLRSARGADTQGPGKTRRNRSSTSPLALTIGLWSGSSRP